MASQPRISRVFGAVNIGSFRISAMIAGITEFGEMIVLGSGHRASQGIKRGYVVDMAAATYATRSNGRKSWPRAPVFRVCGSAAPALAWPVRMRLSKSRLAAAGSRKRISSSC
jgi:hypothetical protein